MPPVPTSTKKIFKDFEVNKWPFLVTKIHIFPQKIHKITDDLRNYTKITTFWEKMNNPRKKMFVHRLWTYMDVNRATGVTLRQMGSGRPHGMESEGQYVIGSEGRYDVGSGKCYVIWSEGCYAIGSEGRYAIGSGRQCGTGQRDG